MEGHGHAHTRPAVAVMRCGGKGSRARGGLEVAAAGLRGNGSAGGSPTGSGRRVGSGPPEAVRDDWRNRPSRPPAATAPPGPAHRAPRRGPDFYH